MSNSDPSRDYRKQLRRAIDRVCNEFETAWRNTPTYTVERILPRLGELVRPFEIDPEEPEVVEQIVSELIRVEMDMRHAARTKLERSDYHRRFPDYSSVIDESWDRIRGLEKGESAADAGLAPTVTGKPNSGAGGSGERVDDGGIMELPQELGPFVEISEIGNGSFGVVCRAVDSRDATRVALKFPKGHVLRDSGMILAFCKEAERVMKLDHPGIVKTYSVEQLDGHLVIVLQLITGTDLKQSLSQSRTQGEIAELVAAIAEALAYANRMGVVHRDLKPANILLDEAGRPFIADFGMALDDASQVGAAPVRCGSIPYMSPQLVAGLTRHLDGRTDIWSLGVILYLMLTGRRPFRGKTDPEIFDQIESRDPKPLRQIDGAIAIELERICLKCLEKRACDRYATGDDLADDLRHWMEQPAESPSQVKAAPDFIPKGLRSYTAEDSEFFLDLLPGPKDRDGMPASIRFWKNRICEPVAEENRVPVGVIYGPSGSGKSSFVKAGLVPQLSPLVEAIYVEATQLDTEVRTIKALRRRFPGIPEDVSIPELFAGLSAGRWQGAPKKILIVMDQFEQHLSKADDYQHSQLAKALRHCDGEHLQCLLLIRDDFWLALTRFVDALEMDLLEGQNSQAIDLFGQTHARKVLIKLGQAYGCLPTEGSELSDDQARFLETAIDQLAIGNYVICVRLTLFAEMFKSRDWTTAELKSVGGVQGVGEKFLEETFGAGNTSRRFQLQRESVQAVLEALLPESGSDIRGSMKSEQELLAASGLAGRPDKFKLLIQTLDTELRLITRTDPDLSGEVQPDGDGSRSATAYFQLTHDYLVPSIREWLSTELKKTRSGRARLRLRELATQVVPGEQPKYLPTNLEWFGWNVFMGVRPQSPGELAVCRHARRQFIRTVSVSGVAIGVAAVGYGWWRVGSLTRENERAIKSLIDNLLGQEIVETPRIIDDLVEYEELARHFLELRLQSVVTQEGDNHLDCLKLDMALFSLGSGVSSLMVDAMSTPECSPSRIVAVASVLRKYSSEAQLGDVNSRLAKIVEDSGLDPKIRFRGACGLVELGEAIPKSQFGFLAGHFPIEPEATTGQWIKILSSVVELRAICLDLLRESQDVGVATVMVRCVYEIGNVGPAKCIDDFIEVIATGNDEQFVAILSLIERIPERAVFIGGLNRKLAGYFFDGDAKAKIKVANYIAASVRLGNLDPITDALCADETIQAFVVSYLGPGRIRFHRIRELCTSVFALKDALNLNLRRTSLLALARHAKHINDTDQEIWTKGIAENRMLTEQDGGCFSACRLVLSRLGFSNSRIVEIIHNRRISFGEVLGDVYINSLDQAYRIISGVSEDGSEFAFAIGFTEVTNREMKRFLRATDNEDDFEKANDDDEKPFQFGNCFLLAQEYSNWLSRETDRTCCYPQEMNLDEVSLHPAISDEESPGYRMPDFTEWTTACHSRQFVEDCLTLSHQYAWTFKNSPGTEGEEVAQKLPSRVGVFDGYGNVYEVCEQSNNELEFKLRGGSTRGRPGIFSRELSYVPGRPISQLVGIRIALTLNL